MLTQVGELGVSGINGVERDAVELPSQFMENFCWEFEVLSGTTQHVDSGEPLLRALFEAHARGQEFPRPGMMTLRQIVFSSFDMHLHTDFDPHGAEVRSARPVARGSRGPCVHVDAASTRCRAGPILSASSSPAAMPRVLYSYKWARSAVRQACIAVRGSRAALPARCARQRNPARATSARSCRSAVAAPRWITIRRVRESAARREIDALLRHGGMAA
ncbi:M3 family metallopeptidase [Cupriavidus basilensis]